MNFRKNKKAFSLIEISMVILIIGILIAGVVTANSLIAKSRLSSAKTLTASSPINGIKDSALWLETSLDSSIAETEAANNTPVTSWKDIRENSPNKVSVVAVGTGPVYSNTINYVHAVKFAGSSENYLQIPDASFLNNTDYTIIVLEKRMAAAGSNYFIGSAGVGANDSLALGYSSDTNIAHSQGTNVYSTPASVSSYSDSNGKARIFTFVQSSADGKKTYVNGLLAAQSSNTAQLSGITALDIGKGYNGEIGEIAIFTRALKAEERKSIEDYIGKKWTAKINRDSVSSGVCVGYTVTDSGCDLSSASCSINIAGLIYSAPAAASSTPISCNQVNYTGSVSYTCINGNLNVTGSCTPANPCSVTPTGVSTVVTANHGATGSSSCNVAGYSGTASYTCSNGTPTYISQCSEITCSITGVSGFNDKTGLVYAASATTISSPCQGGYNPSTSPAPSYTCTTTGAATVTGTCTNSIKCTGGSTSTYTVAGETIHVFTSSGSLNCSQAVTGAKILVVGGGGGGGSGGGGAGGVVYNSSYNIPSGNNSLTVGNGGGFGVHGGATATNGQASQFGTIIANGGGYGGKLTGGSLGAAGASSGGNGCDNTATPASPTQGFIGAASFRAGYGSGGGGGGAGGAGSLGISQSGDVGIGGNGGAGSTQTITGGAGTVFGGGGGGGVNSNSVTVVSGGLGGTGGGGNGARNPNGTGTAGTPNTGGGGGGGDCEGSGAAGGSGIVIIRYTN